MSEKRGYLVESITVLLSPAPGTAETAGEMTVEGMNAAEKGTMTACLPEETHTATATTADVDAAAAIVVAVAEAGAKTEFETETGIESETENGTGTAHGAGPTAGVGPAAGAETEILEKVAQKVLMFTHLLQLYHLRQQPFSPSRL